MKKTMKVCLACSAGGHLTEIMALRGFYSKTNYFFLTFERHDTKSLVEKEKVFFVKYPSGFYYALLSFYDCFKTIMKEKPDIVVSTGSHVGVFSCLAAKLLGKKAIFIESFCRTKSPSKSGKIAYLFCDLLIYQWRDLEKFYPKGVYGGSIF